MCTLTVDALARWYFGMLARYVLLVEELLFETTGKVFSNPLFQILLLQFAYASSLSLLLVL
jgi:hypothetical protein